MIIIGEKLNGAIPAVGKAVSERNKDWIRERAILQMEAGCDYLDVAAGLSERGEAEALKWMVETVQEAVDTPLCIDSPDPEAILSVLPLVKKPGLINSVSLAKGKLERIFPEIAATDWSCIALLEKASGIPDTASGRLEAFSQLLEAASKAGIAEERLFFDPLVTTLSTNEQTYTVFSECCRGIRAVTKKAHITSGLSNVSFGLPNRIGLNQAFLAMAMAAGMDSAILDPTNQNLMGVLFAADALLGNDEYCMNYITAFREERFGH